MAVLTERLAEQLEHDAVRVPIPEIAAYLQEHLGQRMAAHLVGLSDSRHIGRVARGQHTPNPTLDRRLREGYKVTRMLVDAYDDATAKAWLFGTNTRLDDQAPIEMLAAADSTKDFALVVRAARQFASVDW
jgi:hypothetical protein